MMSSVPQASLVPIGDRDQGLSLPSKAVLAAFVGTSLVLTLGFFAFLLWQHYHNQRIHQSRKSISSSIRFTDRERYEKVQQTSVVQATPTPEKKSWRAPLLMLGCLLAGLALIVGHHFFYHNIDGQPIQDIKISQSWVLRLGNLFAFVIKVLLSVVIGVAFVQIQWVKLRQHSMKVNDIDSLSSILGNILNFAVSAVWLRYPLLTTVAVACWLLPVIPVITPGTITVVPNLYTNMTQLQVPEININDDLWSIQEAGPGARLLLPSPSIGRITMASAVLGAILPIQFDQANASYSLDFHAPALKCYTSQDPSVLSAAASIVPPLEEQSGYIYYSWVAGENISSNSIHCGYDENNLDSVSTDSAKLYIMVDAYGLESEVAGDVTECSLYNATYSLDFSFINTEQDIVIRNIDYHHGVAPMIEMDNFTAASEEATAYGGLMAAFGSLFVGSIEAYGHGDADSRQCTSINSLPLNTSFSHGDTTALDNFQRSVEGMFSNITISLLNSPTLRKNASEASFVPVNVTVVLTTYNYNSFDLILSYGIAVLVTIICALLGFHAFLINNGSYQNVFSTFIRATKHADLIIEDDDVGADPIPRDLKHSLVMMARNVPVESLQQDQTKQHLIPRKPVPVQVRAREYESSDTVSSLGERSPALAHLESPRTPR